MSLESAKSEPLTQPGIPCLVCRSPMGMRPSRGRKSGKPFIMVICNRDGRHFRGFITYQPYVFKVLERLDDGEGMVG